MARVYSAQFLNDSPGDGDTVTAAVPAGHLWVVRSIDCQQIGAQVPPSSGFVVYMGGARPIWQRLPGSCFGGRPYQWRGRQVITEGEEIAVTVTGEFWQVMASGYDLTLP